MDLRGWLLCIGKWTVQQAAELSVPAPTIEAALDGRFLSGLKDERVGAAKIFSDLGLKEPTKHEVRRVPPFPSRQRLDDPQTTCLSIGCQHAC